MATLAVIELSHDFRIGQTTGPVDFLMTWTAAGGPKADGLGVQQRPLKSTKRSNSDPGNRGDVDNAAETSRASNDKLHSSLQQQGALTLHWVASVRWCDFCRPWSDTADRSGLL